MGRKWFVCGYVESVVVEMSPEEIEAKRKEEEAATAGGSGELQSLR